MTISVKKGTAIYVTENWWSTQTYMKLFSLQGRQWIGQVYNKIWHSAMKSSGLLLIMEVQLLKPRDLEEQTCIPAAFTAPVLHSEMLFSIAELKACDQTH